MNSKKMNEKGLFATFKKHILPAKEVVDQAFNDIIAEKKLDATYIKSHFSELVVAIQERAYSIFLDSQRIAWSRSIEAYLVRELSEQVTRAEVTKLLADRFDELDSFFP